nr:helix-turn-helix domain-containing protein [Methylobacterium terricola]
MTCAYRLPRSVADRLETALSGRKNAAACLALAHFLARFWSSPRRRLCALPVDRRALAGHEALGLSEARVRGALAVLVEVGFLARYEPDPGKRYQRTEGGLQRRAILHRFGEEYAVAFTAANARAQAARGAPAPARRPNPASRAPTDVSAKRRRPQGHAIGPSRPKAPYRRKPGDYG